MSVVARIPLTRGLTAMVDSIDEPIVRAVGKWHSHVDRNGRFYAARRNGQQIMRMHSFLTGWPMVDHINGDGLDNRRANLRQATLEQNAQNRGMTCTNSSGYKGVCWHKARGRWCAYITANHARYSLGYFLAAEDAALAYDAAAIRLHGQFARLNFPKVVA